MVGTALHLVSSTTMCWPYGALGHPVLGSPRGLSPSLLAGLPVPHHAAAGTSHGSQHRPLLGGRSPRGLRPGVRGLAADDGLKGAHKQGRLGPTEAYPMAVRGMPGAGIFAVLGPAVEIAGQLAAVSFLTTGVLTFLWVWSYADRYEFSSDQASRRSSVDECPAFIFVHRHSPDCSVGSPSRSDLPVTVVVTRHPGGYGAGVWAPKSFRARCRQMARGDE